MKNIKIFPKDWLQLHPYKQSTPVDSYYTGIANRIYDIMEKTELVNSFEGEETKQICIRMAAYFEDVISGMGLGVPSCLLYTSYSYPALLLFWARDEETASWIYPQYVIPILLATLSGNYAVRFHQAILEKFLPGLAFRVTGLWSKRNRTLSRRRRHEFI